MSINCEEHRKTMELLSLKLRLEQGVSDPKERQELMSKIQELERELQMD